MIRAQARAPASTANLGPGFDAFGLAVDAFYDTVTITDNPEGGISISSNDDIPLEPSGNTAGIVVRRMQEEFGSRGVRIHILKGVPPGYGMGSSAASAAAAAVAYDRLCGLGLSDQDLTRYAGYGEVASAGSIHYDNVAAAIYGGFVIVRGDPPRVVDMPAPQGLVMCIAVPRMSVPQQKSKISRGLIPRMVPLKDATANMANAASMAAGFARGDIPLICDCIADAIVEPARRGMIPGFDRIKELALAAGALGVTISGAGPSMIAFADNRTPMDPIRAAMEKGFWSSGVKCLTIPCRPSAGARQDGNA